MAFKIIYVKILCEIGHTKYKTHQLISKFSNNAYEKLDVNK